MKTHFIRHLGRACILVLFSGCALFSTTREVQLSLPAEHGEIIRTKPPQTWTIRWLANLGTVKEIQVQNSQSISLTIPREMPLIVEARPNIPNMPKYWKMHPAGIVRGVNTVPGTSEELRWEEGFAANLLLDLGEKKFNLLKINVERIAQTVETRGEGCPWNINRTKLATEIQDTSLWVYSVKLLEETSVRLALPTGTWHSLYPLDPPIISENTQWDGSLSHGIHYLICLETLTIASILVYPDQSPLLLLDNLNNQEDRL